MAGLSDGLIYSGVLEGEKALKVIPLVIRYAAGVPSIVFNPLNEVITLTDTGTGNVLLTLASASLAPLHVQATVRPTDPTALGNVVNINGATTTTTVSLVNNIASDGVTEVDPVDLHISISKLVSVS